MDGKGESNKMKYLFRFQNKLMESIL